MSRQNKVNKGLYTQRGRLTPDEGAREEFKQREAAGTQPDPTTPKIGTANARAGEAAKARKPKSTRRM